MNRLMLSLVWLLPVVFIGQLAGTEAPQTETDGIHSILDQREFVGAEKCKTCHRKEAAGEQFQIWESSAHARAFETLGTDKAKEYGAEKGIEDPQTSDECLQCHVTAFDVEAEFLGTKYDKAQGVGCESCHGPGGDYYKKKTMISTLIGEIEAESVGLIKPDEQVCVQCHNDRSPAFKGFDFEEKYAKIVHPIPEATKAEHMTGE